MIVILIAIRDRVMLVMRLLLFITLIVFLIGQIFFAVNNNDVFENRHQEHAPEKAVPVEASTYVGLK